MEQHTNERREIQLEKFFRLSERGTDVRTEFTAGIITFMTMAYILAVNPTMLSATGMDAGAVFTATAIASAIACFIMAFYANMPFALSAGMGLNAYFTFTIVITMGYTWQQALGAIFVEGLLFILLTLGNIREAIFNAIPVSQKHSLTVGIGLFLCFIGLQNAHIVVQTPTLIGAFSFQDSIMKGTFPSEGVSVLFALICILLSSYLIVMRVRGALLIGILLIWFIGIISEVLGFYVPNPEAGFYSVIPENIVSMPASISSTFMAFDLSELFSVKFLTILLAFLMVDLFDTLGTVIGVASKVNMIDEKGHFPHLKKVLMADALGTTAAAICGTSTVTTFVESSSGIAAGGRTGLTSVVVGALFLISLFFSPLFLAIPAFATSPILVIVGFMMVQQVQKIDWNDLLEAFPAFIGIVALVFFYSISEGIAFGIISYTFLNFAAGRRDKLTPLMYVLSVIFLVNYFMF